MAMEQKEEEAVDPRTDPGWRGLNPLSITGWLIIVNVAVYLLDCATTRYLTFPDGKRIEVLGPVFDWGVFTAQKAVFEGQVWRFVTFQFLHANYVHLTFNMVALFFFGPLMEANLGRMRYLVFYLVCGMAGPVSYLIFCWLHVADADRTSTLVGASAGVFGILIAAAQVLPDAQVLIYGVIPARLRTVAWILLGVAIYTVFTNGRNAGGEAAHLGGAAVGYLLIRKEGWWGGESTGR